LRVTTALLTEPASLAPRREADEAYEVVVGHRGVPLENSVEALT
jgi:hypothetical protein